MAEYLQSGRVVGGRYRIEQLVGEGGMAAVYRVRHAQLDTMHALKVLTISSKSVQRRLMQEGRVQAAINHPNILSVTDVVDVDGAPGLVMEFIRGPALDDFLKQKALSARQVDTLVTPILDGVAAAHGLGLIHRDLKPANVMLAITPHGLLPKVADFGLVKLLDEGSAEFSKTRSGMAMGTPAYMAPEQIRDAKNVDARADIWSLGAILYEMASGQRAFPGEGDLLDMFNRVASGEFVSLREVAPDLPERMYTAVEAAMTTDRDARVESVAKLKALWLGKESEVDMSSEDLLSAAQLMGGGNEETSEFLKRSFRSSSGYKAPVAGDTSPTAVPGAGMSAVAADGGSATAVPQDVGSVETFYPDAGGGEGGHNTQATLDFEAMGDDAAGTLEPSFDEHVAAAAAATVLTPAADQAPAARDTRTLALGLMGVGLAGLVLTLGGGAWMYSNMQAEEAVVTEPSNTVETPETPEVTGTEQGGDATGEPALDVEVAPEPEPSGTTDPQPVVTPEPVVEVTAEPEVEPEVAPEPEPEAGGTADPEPEVTPEPEVEPQGTAAAAPRVVLKSDVTVFFLDSANKPTEVGDLGVGTYRVMAVYDPANPDDASEVETITLAEGDVVNIRCLGSRRRCLVSR